MDAIERDEHLKKLKHLIERKTKGSADDIAAHMQVSRRTVFRLINHLKIREQQDIKYCKKQKHFYFYENE
jgi:Mn-dependent DtxR family transcriptional regulator